ncbi:MAG TPA: glycine zipper 2TM domain-containing protein [Erythrobacter sp.]|nr:glycine zipper 2TM domain-containing protein [Erythrobacter sp.]
MKLFALVAAAGSLAALAVPAQAAELPAATAPIGVTSFAGFNHSAAPAIDVAGYDRDRRYRNDRRYRDNRRWDDGRRLGRNDRVWRGNDGRYRCKRNDGTTGLVIGAVGGALAGRAVDTRGDRSLGTILGAVGGGLLGREIDRGGARCR